MIYLTGLCEANDYKYVYSSKKVYKVPLMSL